MTILQPKELSSWLMMRAWHNSPASDDQKIRNYDARIALARYRSDDQLGLVFLTGRSSRSQGVAEGDTAGQRKSMLYQSGVNGIKVGRTIVGWEPLYAYTTDCCHEYAIFTA